VIESTAVLDSLSEVLKEPLKQTCDFEHVAFSREKQIFLKQEKMLNLKLMKEYVFPQLNHFRDLCYVLYAPDRPNAPVIDSRCSQAKVQAHKEIAALLVRNDVAAKRIFPLELPNTVTKHKDS